VSTAKSAADKEPEINDLDLPLGIAVSVRLPAKIAYLLYFYAERMNTSPGKLLTSLLEDALPAFTEAKKSEVTLRVPQVYRAMQGADLLRSVNTEDLKRQMLRRYQGSGRSLRNYALGPGPRRVSDLVIGPWPAGAIDSNLSRHLVNLSVFGARCPGLRSTLGQILHKILNPREKGL